MNSTNQIALFVTARLLAKGKLIDHFSFTVSVIFLITFIGMCWVADKVLLIISLSVFLIGVIEKYYALRTRLDAELFAYLAQYIEQLPANVQQLDNALLELGLIKPAGQTRSLVSRQQGALSLLKKQVLSCVLQVILVIVFGLWIII